MFLPQKAIHAPKMSDVTHLLKLPSLCDSVPYHHQAVKHKGKYWLIFKELPPVGTT